VPDLPFRLPEPLALRLRTAADAEGKIVRVLDALGPLAGRDVAILDLPAGPLRDRFAAAGIDARDLPLADPLRLDLPDESLDALISPWGGFRGVRAADLAEADRVLRPGGRLLVIHDYGRDDVSALAEAGAPEYGAWSRREGPFLRGGGFRIRVIHAFWTFPSIEEAREFLVAAFGERGAAVGAGLKRPRLAWNVAIYHRWRGGLAHNGDDQPEAPGLVSSAPPAAPIAPPRRRSDTKAPAA
jgi:SAM-dependent methyltransferase